VLDVATGTSRLPLALCKQPLFRGQIIALDNARRMLQVATEYVRDYRDRITWVWQHAVPLPFDDHTFDLVTCLEAFEFMPSTRDALSECVRVLKPGGLLLVTNRVGSGAGCSSARPTAKRPSRRCCNRWGKSISQRKYGSTIMIWCGPSSRMPPEPRRSPWNNPRRRQANKASEV
jgi:ubiquinone/menaquinone biosynthesis C-methylase UbiE